MKAKAVWIGIVAAWSLGSLAAPAVVRAQVVPGSPTLSISSTMFVNAGILPPFANGSAIPAKYACPNLTDPNGGGTIPPLVFSNIPVKTQSLALIVDDPDAPGGLNAAPNTNMGWVHWVVYNMDAATAGVQEGTAPTPAAAGLNDYGTSDYRGPCPPAGSGTHRYFFKLYALDSRMTPAITPPNAAPTKADLEKAMQGRILGEAALVGTYG